MLLIPQTGTTVFVRGLPPFDQILYDSKYILTRNVLLSEVDSLNPLEEVYLPAGLTVKDLNNDSNNNVPLLTFSNGSTSSINIPANRVEFLDDALWYTQFGIGINLGLLPHDTNFSDFNIELIELVRSRFGITPTVKLAQLSDEIKVDYSIHNKLLSERSIISEKLSCFSQNAILKSTIETLNNQLVKLKTCLRNK